MVDDEEKVVGIVTVSDIIHFLVLRWLVVILVCPCFKVIVYVVSTYPFYDSHCHWLRHNPCSKVAGNDAWCSEDQLCNDSYVLSFLMALLVRWNWRRIPTNIWNIAKIAKAAIHKLPGKSSLNVSFVCLVIPNKITLNHAFLHILILFWPNNRLTLFSHLIHHVKH